VAGDKEGGGEVTDGTEKATNNQKKIGGKPCVRSQKTSIKVSPNNQRKDKEVLRGIPLKEQKRRFPSFRKNAHNQFVLIEHKVGKRLKKGVNA